MEIHRISQYMNVSFQWITLDTQKKCLPHHVESYSKAPSFRWFKLLNDLITTKKTVMRIKEQLVM